MRVGLAICSALVARFSVWALNATPKILCRSTQSTLEVERSKFIARAHIAVSVEQALARVAESRTLDPKASHHCWAWRGRTTTGRCSDDGEPSSTAGRPILAALESSGVVDTVVVVTRYFGGVKLGTGGLSRAYGAATRQVLLAAELKAVVDSIRLRILVPQRQDVSRVYQVALSKLGLDSKEIREEEHTHGETGGSCLLLVIPTSEREAAVTKITEATGGRVSITEVAD